MDQVQVTPRVNRPVPIKFEDDPPRPREMDLLGRDLLCSEIELVVVRCGPS